MGSCYQSWAVYFLYMYTGRPKKNVTISIPPQKIITNCMEMRLWPLKVDTWEFCVQKEWRQYLNQSNHNHSFCNFAVFGVLASLAQSIFWEISVMHPKWWKHAVKSGFCRLFFGFGEGKTMPEGHGTHWKILRTSIKMQVLSLDSFCCNSQTAHLCYCEAQHEIVNPQEVRNTPTLWIGFWRLFHLHD